MIPFLVLLTILFAVVVGVELLSRVFRMPIELSRKSTHILTGVAVALSAWFVAQPYLVLLSVMFVVVILISKRRGIFRSIHDPERAGIGDVWYPIGILLAALFFPEPEIFTYAVLVLAVSDGLAGLIGKTFGKRKIGYIGAPKTYLGTFVFIASAFLLGLFVPLPPFVAFAAAVYLALVELLSVKGMDNLILPLAAGIIAFTFR